MKILDCLNRYGYIQCGNHFVKPIKNLKGEAIINAMFSVKHGHYPINLKISKKGFPRVKWEMKNKKVITEQNIEQLCKDVDRISKNFRIAEVDYALSKIEQNVERD